MPSFCFDRQNLFMPSRKVLRNFLGQELFRSKELKSVYTLLDDFRLKTRNFHGIDLSGLNMPGVDLSELNLSFGKFYFGEFQFSRFMNSVLRNADFSSARLDNSSFLNSDLEFANFSESSLVAVNFENANLCGVNFSKSNLQNANFKNTIIDDTTDFTGCDLTKTNMDGEMMDAIYDFARMDSKVKADILKMN